MKASLISCDLFLRDKKCLMYENLAAGGRGNCNRTLKAAVRRSSCLRKGGGSCINSTISLFVSFTDDSGFGAGFVVCRLRFV